MIRRLLRLLLVPLMLANQGLCFGHVHPGGGFAEPEDHASRPHFHLGGHHGASHNHRHSGHSHDEPEPEPAADADQQGADQQGAGFAAALTGVDKHDSDVVYFTGPCTVTRATGSAGVAWTKYVATIPVGHLVNYGDRLLRPGTVRGQPASVFDTACPIYLRTLSLRI